MITFAVQGVAIPQGSKSVVMRGRTPVLVDQQDMPTKHLPKHRLKDWRAKVADAANVAMSKARQGLAKGPVDVECCFYYERPASHLRKDGSIRKGYESKLPRPDCDKLFRAMGDALSGIVYIDDRQIRRQVACKAYADAAYTTVEVRA